MSQSPSVEATALQCGLFCHLRFELKTSKHSVRGVFFQKRFTIGSQFTRRHDGDIIAYLAPSPMHIPTRLGVNHADHVYHAKHVKSRKSCKSRKWGKFHKTSLWPRPYLFSNSVCDLAAGANGSFFLRVLKKMKVERVFVVSSDEFEKSSVRSKNFHLVRKIRWAKKKRSTLIRFSLDLGQMDWEYHPFWCQKSHFT